MMTFPEAERVVYDKNPLAEVVCQLQFHRVFALEDRVPSNFQKLLGHGYPVASASEILNLQISFGENVSPGQSKRIVYEFQNAAKDLKISLCSDFIAVSTTKYERWEKFKTHIDIAISSLTGSYQVENFTRIGLRYINNIDKSALEIDEKWSKLIKHQVLGVFGMPDFEFEKFLQHTCVSTIRLPDGKINIHHGLSITDGKPDGKYVVDCDLYADEKVEELENAIAILSKFNTSARNAFRWIITDKLHDILSPRKAD